MTRPATIPAALLVEDLSFWPRYSIDGPHVNSMAEALLAGEKLPPIAAERSSRRIVDGFHRVRAAIKAHGPEAQVEVFWLNFDTPAKMFEEAVRLNASHGRKLTSFDHARIMERAKELGIDPERVAEILHMRVVKLKEKGKYGYRRGDKKTRVALKRPLRNLDGQEMTPEQERYNAESSGWTPAFHAKQLVLAIEAGMPEISEHLAKQLLHLHELIEALELEVTAQDDAA